MLTALMLLLPLLAALALLVPGPTFEKKGNIHMLALGGTLVSFALSLVLAGQFNWSDTASFSFASTVDWVSDWGLAFSFGVDSISLWLILLTTFLMPLVVLGSVSSLGDDVVGRSREFFFWLLVLESAMLGTFIARDVIFFYICFEFTLVPLYFLIGIFGGTQRLKAARVFFLYTFTGSMLTLAGIIYVAYLHASLNEGAWTFGIAELTATAQTMNASQQFWVFLALLAGFAVKVPVFPVHTWLPLAHTEAPTAGSVILAGVLLKLGTYGLLRFAIPMCPQAAVELAPVIGSLAIVGILYTALICWVQKDIKKLIAYSSVSHLGFCVLGLFALGSTQHMGQSGAVAYMVNHGLSTGALFLCVGMIYERYHTREIRQYGGLAKTMPVWSFFMVYFSLASVGLPGLNGFVGEFLTLIGAFNSPHTLGPIFAAVAGVGMIFAAIYILYMVGCVVFGPVKLPESHDHGHTLPATTDAHNHDHGVVPPKARDLNGREIATLIPLAVGCLVLGLYPAPLLRSLDAPIEQLVQPARQIVQDRIASESLTLDPAGLIPGAVEVMVNPNTPQHETVTRN